MLSAEKKKWIKEYRKFIDTETLFISKRGEINEPRNVAVYLCRKLRRDRLTEICNYFRMNKYISVISIIRIVKNQ